MSNLSSTSGPMTVNSDKSMSIVDAGLCSKIGTQLPQLIKFFLTSKNAIAGISQKGEATAAAAANLQRTQADFNNQTNFWSYWFRQFSPQMDTAGMALAQANDSLSGIATTRAIEMERPGVPTGLALFPGPTTYGATFYFLPPNYEGATSTLDPDGYQVQVFDSIANASAGSPVSTVVTVEEGPMLYSAMSSGVTNPVNANEFYSLYGTRLMVCRMKTSQATVGQSFTIRVRASTKGGPNGSKLYGQWSAPSVLVRTSDTLPTPVVTTVLAGANKTLVSWQPPYIDQADGSRMNWAGITTWKVNNVLVVGSNTVVSEITSADLSNATSLTVTGYSDVAATNAVTGISSSFAFVPQTVIPRPQITARMAGTTVYITSRILNYYETAGITYNITSFDWTANAPGPTTTATTTLGGGNWSTVATGSISDLIDGHMYTFSVTAEVIGAGPASESSGEVGPLEAGTYDSGSSGGGGTGGGTGGGIGGGTDGGTGGTVPGPPAPSNFTASNSSGPIKSGSTTTKRIIHFSGTGVTAGLQIQLRDNSTAVSGAITTVDGDGNWFINGVNLEYGSYSFSVTASDLTSGKTSVPSQRFELHVAVISIDRVTTTTGGVDVLANDGYTNQYQLTFTGSGDGGSYVNLHGGEYGVQGALIKSDGVWTLTETLEQQITYTYYVTAFKDGVESTASSHVDITFDLIAPDPVSIQSVMATIDGSALNNNDITNKNALTFTGSGINGNTTILYRFNMNAIEFEEGTGQVMPTGSWTISVSGLPDGYSGFFVKARDKAGNVSGTSGTFYLDIKANPPNPLTIQQVKDDGGNGVDNDNFNVATTSRNFVFAGSGGILGYQIKLYERSTLPEGQYTDPIVVGTATSQSGSWSVSIYGRPVGRLLFTATITDLFERESQHSPVYQFTII